MSFEQPSATETMLDAVLSNGLANGVYSHFVNDMGLRGDETVVDIGCGSGAGTRHIAERLALAGGRLTCVDSSPAWIEVARKRLARYRRIELIVADAALVELPPSTFDVAVIHLMLHDVPPARRPMVMRRVAESLKAGGRVFVREPVDATRHGVTPDDLRRDMESAGLRELRGATERVMLMGPCYRGVFGHSDPAR
jgi:ubiquinone/menaquinone biosynthesis C-methylase UbiE